MGFLCTADTSDELDQESGQRSQETLFLPLVAGQALQAGLSSRCLLSTAVSHACLTKFHLRSGGLSSQHPETLSAMPMASQTHNVKQLGQSGTSPDRVDH